jgi:hypothetical protein
MPLHNFLLMNMYTILKYRRSHTKSSGSIYLNIEKLILDLPTNDPDQSFNNQSKPKKTLLLHKVTQNWQQWKIGAVKFWRSFSILPLMLSGPLALCGLMLSSSFRMPGVVMVSGGISGWLAYKKGEKYNAANYRPISLTCISCKIMEHVITKHVLNHLESNSLLYDL